MPAIPEPIRKWRDLLGGEQLARPGNNVMTLVDGDETYDAMYRALLTARSKGHYIYLLGWSCDSTVGLLGRADGSRSSSTSLEAVLRKVPREVQIRAMLWRQIWRKKKTEYYVRNETTIKMINSLPNGAAISDKYTPLRRNSHHQKILIINGSDGVIAFCGGVDIYPDRVLAVSDMLGATSSGGPNGSPQHDVHCRIQGPACEDLLKVFDQRWCSHPDTRAIDLDVKRGPLIWRQSSNFYRKGAAYVRVTRTFNCVLQAQSSTGAGDDDTSADEDPSDPEALKRLSKRTCKKERSIAEVLFASIENSEKFIYVEEQYMIDLKVAEALNKAVKKGTHIIFLIPHTTITNVPGIAKRRKTFIETVLRDDGKKDKDNKRGSFRVYYLVDPKTGKIGQHCYVHAKTWMFDDEMAIIGSANCNRRGLSSDSEANVCVFDAPGKGDSVAKALRKRLWKEHLGLKNADEADEPVKSAGLWQKRSDTSRVREYDPAKAKEPPSGGDPEAADYGGIVDPDLDGLPACSTNDCAGCSAAFAAWA